MAILISPRLVVGVPFDPGGSPAYFTLYNDAGGYVRLQPKFDFKEKIVKDETAHRALTGAEFKYIWGYFQNWKFSVEYVSSEQISWVNTWWLYNHNCKFRFQGNDPIPVRIVNTSTPIAQRHKGRHDLFKGVIELETYQ